MNLLKFVICLILMAIAWQDFKYRAVYWWLFPLLMLFLSLEKLNEQSLSNWKNDFIVSFCFLMLQLSFISIYLSLKSKRFINLFERHFGWGDFLFLGSLGLYFSFLNFLGFYLISLLIIITCSSLKHLIFSQKRTSIPLAGEQALLFLICLLYDLRHESINLTDDSWISRLLYL